MDCLDLYTKLTICYVLVAHVPAFIVSLAAGLIVTRTSGRSNLGEAMIGQLLAKPKALIITGIFLAIMTLTALPKIPLLILGTSCGARAWILTKNETKLVAATAMK